MDGCPPLLELSEADIQPELDRRAPGQSHIVTQRRESDTVRLLSGVFEGKTLGAPINMLIPNEDCAPATTARCGPSPVTPTTHDAKYGFRDWRGGGRTSARETAGRVAAGAIARKLLRERYGVEIVAWVSKVHHLAAVCDVETVTRDEVDCTPIRCRTSTWPSR
ncbi:MAG: chorismate synthase [Dehalococcoidia bacterium]